MSGIDDLLDLINTSQKDQSLVTLENRLPRTRDDSRILASATTSLDPVLLILIGGGALGLGLLLVGTLLRRR